MTTNIPCPYCGRQRTRADTITRSSCAGCGATRFDITLLILRRPWRPWSGHSLGQYTSLTGSTASAMYLNISFDTSKW